ncbi:MAG: hypothetical protein F6K63_01925 [Moorea sp. SIO1G6]|uniref:hypothetical protein n=1 Tax=Moorena sp. SIO1G6 TaxID=2607840 RepID=UPI0013BED779|nr:hypothetical protein [Moorena sp. SIO1G6]NET63219.1 hypothetical protein [Moorena sp. SIO1G6]
MSYSPSLQPWVMIRLLRGRPPLVFARFCSPSDARSYSQAMKHLMPDAKFLIFLDRSLPMDEEE